MTSSEGKGSDLRILLFNFCFGSSDMVLPSSHQEGMCLLSVELWIDVPSLALQLPRALGECYWVRFMASENPSPSSGINGHRSFII